MTSRRPPLSPPPCRGRLLGARCPNVQLRGWCRGGNLGPHPRSWSLLRHLKWPLFLPQVALSPTPRPNQLCLLWDVTAPAPGSGPGFGWGGGICRCPLVNPQGVGAHCSELIKDGTLKHFLEDPLNLRRTSCLRADVFYVPDHQMSLSGPLCSPSLHRLGYASWSQNRFETQSSLPLPVLATRWQCL